jgi:hypothetical protein
VPGKKLVNKKLARDSYSNYFMNMAVWLIVANSTASACVSAGGAKITSILTDE